MKNLDVCLSLAHTLDSSNNNKRVSVSGRKPLLLSHLGKYKKKKKSSKKKFFLKTKNRKEKKRNLGIFVTLFFVEEKKIIFVPVFSQNIALVPYTAQSLFTEQTGKTVETTFWTKQNT